ncbi:MAG: DUF3450 family protein, partial [Pseudomonadota bacterium]
MKDNKIIKGCLLGFILMGLAGAAHAEDKLDKAMKEQIKVGDESASSQKKVTSYSDKSKDLYENFKAVQKQIENTKIYNEQMRKLITSQEEEMVSMKQQIVDLKKT